MLTSFNKAKAGSFGKWMLMPVMLLLFTGFTLRKTPVTTGIAAPFIVMIDAGHGGERSGAIAPDGTKEKDLNLLIAKKIRDLNQDANIKIVMTRDNDIEPSLRERVAMANNAKADAFISIHVNRDVTGGSGIQLYMTKNTNEYSTKSQLLGTLVSQELQKVYKIDGELRKGRPDQGIWVLDAPEISYPSLMVECGNMLNDHDLEFVKSESNQEKIAQQILSAIKLYAENKSTYRLQSKPSAIEVIVEEGNIDFKLRDNKIINSDWSLLKKASTKNIFPGDSYQASGSAFVFVDGIYMADNSKSVNHLSVGKNMKLILVSSRNVNPLEMLVN